MTGAKQQKIESPLAQAMRHGTLGGKPPGQETKTEDETGDRTEAAKLTLQQPSKPKREKQSVYLSPDLLRWVKHQAVDQNKEISEVVEEALQQYRSRLEHEHR